MAYEVYFKSSRGFLDDNKIAWAPIFQAVKAIIKHNDISDSTRTCIKTWLKASDSMVALMALTVIETLACNAPLQLRTQMSGARWMERFEKLLMKPQSSVVQSGVAQLLVDYVHLFSNEDLGRVALNLLNQSKNSWWQSMAPSPEAQDIRSEWQLGLPPVGPYKAHDFTQVLRQAMASSSGSRSDALPASGSGSALSSLSRSSTPAQPLEGSVHAGGQGEYVTGAGAGALVHPSALSGRAVLTSATTRSTASSRLAVGGSSGAGAASKPDPKEVLELTAQMHDASRSLQEVLAAARASLRQVSGSRATTASLHSMWAQRLAAPHHAAQGAISPALPPGLIAHVDTGFQISERCSRWRSRVAQLCQALSDPTHISKLLAALDAVNAALTDWQRFSSGGELFGGLGLTGDLAGPWKRSSSPAAPQAEQTAALLDLDDPPQTAASLHNAGLMDELTALTAPRGSAHLPAVSIMPLTQTPTANTHTAAPPAPPHQPCQPPVFQAASFTSHASSTSFPVPPDPHNPFNNTHLPGLPATSHPASSTSSTSLHTQYPTISPPAHGPATGHAALSTPFTTLSANQAVSVMTRGVPNSTPLPTPAPAPAAHRSVSQSHDYQRCNSSNGTGAPAAPVATRTGSFSADSSTAQLEPDWQAELGSIITNSASRHMVSLRLEGELRELVTRMQQHYVHVISTTKEKAVQVVKQLKQQVQEQQELQQQSCRAVHMTPAPPPAYTAGDKAGTSATHFHHTHQHHPHTHQQAASYSPSQPATSSQDDAGSSLTQPPWQTFGTPTYPAVSSAHTFNPFPRPWEPPVPAPGAAQASGQSSYTGRSHTSTTGKAAAYPVVTTTPWDLI